MRIHDIQAIGLAGATPKGGWSEELRPEYTVHTLVIVRTDEGLTGIGSVFTNAGLVRAALAVMEPLYRGENALSRSASARSCISTPSGWAVAAVSRTPSAASTSPSGTFSGRRRGSRSGVCWAAATGIGYGPTRRSSWTNRSRSRSSLREIAARGFRAFKIGWGPFGRDSHDARRADRPRRA